jgi:phage terminase large subunit-like protein
MVTAPPAAIRIGPTTIPDKTLGWQILGWTREYLLQPDGPNAGEPWVFTDEQARFVLNWYGVDEQGRFTYRYGMYRRMKGHGKDPLGAALCCIEFVGPCRFDRWENGQPVAAPHNAAWIQVAAVSRDQTRNTMTLFPGQISPRAIEEFQIDIGKEIIYAEKGRKRIEAVTSSPRALEGGRATFILKNETHHWLAPNEGHEMAKVIARNAAKSRDGSSRVLAISNAHAPGEDSDAEHDHEAWTKIAQGVSKATGIHYDSVEAPETDLEDDEAVLAGINACRGDSFWVSPERLLAEIRDPRTTPAMARRFYLNQIVAEEDKPFDWRRFTELAKPSQAIEQGALVTLGFDGSLSRDHTALVVTDVETGHQSLAGYWEPLAAPEGMKGEIAFREVTETVEYAFAHWRVWRIYADPHKWADRIDDWAGQFGADQVVKWDTTKYKRMAMSLQRYRTAIDAGELSHDGDLRFVAAITNAHKHVLNIRDDDNEPMWLIQKERPDSPLKIDAAMAGCLSWEARNDAVASGALESQEVGVSFVEVGTR